MKWEHSYLAHSSEIVVSDVPLSEAASIMLIALAVLKTIGPELLDAEVQEARYMSARGDASSANTSFKLLSLSVTLNNSKVAKRLIAAKISVDKLTNAQLSPDLVQAAQLSLPSRPSAININEYMPKELYDLTR